MVSTDGGPPALSRRRQLLILGIAAGVLAVALILWFSVHRQKTAEPQGSQTSTVFTPTKEQRQEIATSAVTLHSFPQTIAIDGRLAIDDDRTTQVFPPFTGRVTKIFVTAGQAVREGQPLAAFAANELVQAESDLTTANAALRQAETQRQQAQAALARQISLKGAQAAAQRDVDQARTDLATAEQAVETAQANFAAAEGRLNVLNVSRQAGRLNAQVKQGGFARSAVLTSPLTGVVTSRQVGAGQFVDSVAGGASQPIMTVSDLKVVWLVANLRDVDAAAVKIGDAVSASVLGLPNVVLEGRVNYVAPAVDPNLHRVIVRADIANPTGRLRPDMFAEVKVAIGPPQTSPAVPRSAVVYDGTQARVWVETASGGFSLRKVSVGAQDGDLVQILAGLAAGQRIASGGGLFIDQAAQGD